mmetsp:Transcript_24050/g.52351  ORF Transcript_24050/g.52351 Transcript_24050/m.52351 type:complete len:98 (-) Transcript_24050:67-360(-)
MRVSFVAREKPNFDQFTSLRGAGYSMELLLEKPLVVFVFIGEEEEMMKVGGAAAVAVVAAVDVDVAAAGAWFTDACACNPRPTVRSLAARKASIVGL